MQERTMNDDHMAYVARCRGCGAVRMAVVDNPQHARDVAREVANAIRDGYYIERGSAGWVRQQSWECICHQKVQLELEGRE